MSDHTEASSRARLAGLLRRQRAVSRAGDMFWILTGAFVVLAGFMVVVVISDEAQWWLRLVAAGVGVGAGFLGLRAVRAALAMGRWQRDSGRLSSMENVDEIPGMLDVLAGRYP